ncbi:ABC transporter substrate-binding protein [Acidovorax sp. SRB_14]|uniref:Bug family tripartite tricarboxylate transporter substrate binding protein n=1 Tax=unclassified Acidovorax TaxID=2684926 RepID=UPI00145EAE88|nr:MULTISPECIES: tripartite tricarboxylate transporter substrate binding protein [unclassified Acidovorax]NMM78024.1 ABC transporter substrate-binding protein [Acidovorax sp. SRB_24]NMM82573.1 ABC transporter substrate-binding protein [Acidovorax sp. SRB_14]NMM91169.1 ABC transporter substrate-binding protein [Rhodococcus sp. SRB_17]
MKKKHLPAALLVCVLGLFGASAHAQATDYPQRAVRIVVPFAAGGSTDVVARVLADKLGQELKQPFVVDNRAGASGNIGADAVAKAAPDGYTLLMGTTGILSINEHLYKKMSYSPARDLVPVIYTSLIANILVVSPTVPATNVAELITLAKSTPGALSFASSGAGSSTHLSGELFKAMTSTNIIHVPYRGSAQAITDVVAGQVTMLFDNAPSSIPFVRDGKLKALAVTSKKRLPNLPDVPTLEETGVTGYESLSWSGIVAPAGTPKAVVHKLNQAIDRILKMEDVRQRFASLGVDPVGGPPEAFARQIKAETVKWGEIVKSSHIVLD